jgi:hypothetical protein
MCVIDRPGNAPRAVFLCPRRRDTGCETGECDVQRESTTVCRLALDLSTGVRSPPSRITSRSVRRPRPCARRSVDAWFLAAPGGGMAALFDNREGFFATWRIWDASRLSTGRDGFNSRTWRCDECSRDYIGREALMSRATDFGPERVRIPPREFVSAIPGRRTSKCSGECSGDYMANPRGREFKSRRSLH